jgi:hypothetical protein
VAGNGRHVSAVAAERPRLEVQVGTGADMPGSEVETPWARPSNRTSEALACWQRP